MLFLGSSFSAVDKRRMVARGTGAAGVAWFLLCMVGGCRTFQVVTLLCYLIKTPQELEASRGVRTRGLGGLKGEHRGGCVAVRGNVLDV